jgi:hypothetical protein
MLVAQEKFFIDRPRGVGKDSSSIDNYPHNRLVIFDRFQTQLVAMLQSTLSRYFIR